MADDESTEVPAVGAGGAWLDCDVEGEEELEVGGFGGCVPEVQE